MVNQLLVNKIKSRQRKFKIEEPQMENKTVSFNEAVKIVNNLRNIEPQREAGKGFMELIADYRQDHQCSYTEAYFSIARSYPEKLDQYINQVNR